MSRYIMEIKSNIVIPHNFQEMNVEESQQWALENVPIAIEEMRELNNYLNKIPYRTTSMQEGIGVLNCKFQKFVENPNSYMDCMYYKFSYEYDGHIIMRDMSWYYDSHGTPIDHIYPKLIPASVNSDVWKREVAAREKTENATKKMCCNSYNNITVDPDNRHKIRIDENGNKFYQPRPVTYHNLNGLWILIPICLLLCLTGWGGVIFSVVVIVMFLIGQQKNAQDAWERDCEFYSHLKNPYSNNYQKNPIDMSKIDNKK